MIKFRKRSSFTLLELIMVIIVLGVLGGLALPRLFSLIEFSKAKEAFDSIVTIRGSLERCYVQNNATFANCDFGNLDVADPSGKGALFDYAIADQNSSGYKITATRNTINGGDGTSTVVLTQMGKTVSRTGTDVYKGIK